MEDRKYIIIGVFLFFGVLYLAKLFSIQVLTEDYKFAAENNAIQRLTVYPYRGLITDRNHKIIVSNKPVFDLMVMPKDLSIPDTTLFCETIGFEAGELHDLVEAARKYSMVKPSVLIKQLSEEQYARLSTLLIDYPGLFVQPRTVRNYPYASAANALGYIGEISKSQLDIQEEKYYTQGDYIGISGLEGEYEQFLRGKKGVRYMMVNVRGIEKGAFKKGIYDSTAIAGLDITSTLDIELQLYGELLMKGKVGSIVAIEPQSGEVLSLISSPSYDPNLLSGADFPKNFTKLTLDTVNPLFNRPIMAMYRPGSIFKIAQALIGLQERVIDVNTRIPCVRNVVNCHGAHTLLDLEGAITFSCNPYFMNVMRRVVNQDKSKNTYEDTRIGLEVWDKHIMSLGFGKKLGIDLPNEKSGLMPSPEYYDRAYKGRPWKYSNIYSIAIGEGENLIVPLQMANFACIVANKGYFYIPHLVKSIGNENRALPKYREKQFTTIDSQHFEVAVAAMENVVREGTGSYRAKLKDIIVCGKTGTVQTKGQKDHSVFIAFAPKDNPKIAISVYVENSGEGARAAASIASLMIEKYLEGGTKRLWIEQYVLNGNFD